MIETKVIIEKKLFNRIWGLTTDKVHLMAHLAIDKGLNAQEVATILRLPQILQMMKIVRF